MDKEKRENDDKTALEIQLLRLQIELKNKELELKSKDLTTLKKKKTWKLDPILVGITATLIGFLGNVTATYLQVESSQDIERAKHSASRALALDKFRSSLILEAIKTGDTKKASRNLEFFLGAGFIEDSSGKIRAYLSESNEVPVLPSPNLKAEEIPETPLSARRIDGFDYLLDAGIAELRLHLKDKVRGEKVSRKQATDLLPLIRDLNFPALIMFLAKGTNLSLSLREDKIKLFEIFDSKAIRHALKQIPAIAPLEPFQTQSVVDLVQRRTFFGNVQGATAAVLHQFPDIQVPVVQDIRSLEKLPIRLIISIKRDLINFPQLVRSVTNDLLLKGELDRPPVVMENSMWVIFQHAAPFQIAQTVQTLLGNETVQLGIIVYARSKGIRITQKELEAVQDAFDPNTTNLGDLLVPAYERFEKEIGVSNTLALFERLTY